MISRRIRLDRRTRGDDGVGSIGIKSAIPNNTGRHVRVELDSAGFRKLFSACGTYAVPRSLGSVRTAIVMLDGGECTRAVTACTCVHLVGVRARRKTAGAPARSLVSRKNRRTTQKRKKKIKRKRNRRKKRRHKNYMKKIKKKKSRRNV